MCETSGFMVLVLHRVLVKNHTIHTVFFCVRERERKNFFEKKFLPGASNFFVAIYFLIKDPCFAIIVRISVRVLYRHHEIFLIFGTSGFLRIFSPKKISEYGERDRPLHIPVKKFQQLYKFRLFKNNKLTIKGIYLNFFFLKNALTKYTLFGLFSPKKRTGRPRSP